VFALVPISFCEISVISAYTSVSIPEWLLGEKVENRRPYVFYDLEIKKRSLERVWAMIGERERRRRFGGKDDQHVHRLEYPYQFHPEKVGQVQGLNDQNESIE
jgi:hypothetical protein